jgi:hypothetical protein
MAANYYYANCVQHTLIAVPKMSRFFSVIVAGLELRNIERHIFATHFVERSDYAALENRPESFNGLSMDCANDVLASSVIDDGVRIISEVLIANPLISAKQTHFMGDSFSHKSFECLGLNIRDNASNYVAFAADSADDWSFAGTNTTGSVAAAAFIRMSIFGQAADESFVNLNDPAEFIDIFHERDADPMAHIPRGFQRTKTHIAPNLPSAHAFLAGEHQMNDTVPIAERLVGVFENRASDNREAIAIRGALFALPMPLAGFEVINLGIAAAGAMNAIGPAPRVQVSLAGVLIREHGLELWDGQLVNLFWLFRAGHSRFSIVEKH